jgi:hypothetical protein
MMEMGLQEEATLRWHMDCNHYPSVVEFIDVARLAIQLIRDGEHNALVDMADIMGDGRYKSDVPVSEIMDAWHLWDFIQEDEYGEEECD